MLSHLKTRSYYRLLEVIPIHKKKHVYDKQYLARSEGSASGEMGGELVKFHLGKEQVFVFSGSRFFSFTFFLPTFF